MGDVVGVVFTLDAFVGSCVDCECVVFDVSESDQAGDWALVAEFFGGNCLA